MGEVKGGHTRTHTHTRARTHTYTLVHSIVSIGEVLASVNGMAQTAQK